MMSVAFGMTNRGLATINWYLTHLFRGVFFIIPDGKMMKYSSRLSIQFAQVSKNNQAYW